MLLCVQEDGLSQEDVGVLLDTFGRQPLDFFGALRWVVSQCLIVWRGKGCARVCGGGSVCVHTQVGVVETSDSKSGSSPANPELWLHAGVPSVLVHCRARRLC